MNDLWRPLDFGLAIAVWGYDVAGAAADSTARLAERPNEAPWDRTGRYLESIERWHGDQRMDVPDWWALPMVVDWTVAQETRRAA